MDALARTVVTGVICAAVAAAATAWIMNTHANGPDARLSLARLNAMPPEGPAARVPLGDLAGAIETTLPGTLANPLEGQADALTEGHRLYLKMNCAGCHGYTAQGGMGPDLTDGHWRYGGTPVQIYKSIYEGRPQGMPAWGKALPQRSIWQLTRFIESLGGAYPVQGYHAGLQGDLVDDTGDKSSKTPAKGGGGDGGGGGQEKHVP